MRNTQVYWLDAKLHHEQCAKRFLDLRERLLYFEKAVYILEEDAHRSEECQIVQIMQVRWLDNVNDANKVTR